MAVAIIGENSTLPQNPFRRLESGCEELTRGDEAEVLEFLSARSIHTVYLATLIRDNGLVSPHNRGSFYSYRNTAGELEGVALIGHATIIETRTENALAEFATLASRCQNAHLIRGERSVVESFWILYAGAGQPSRLVSREMLFAKRDAAPIADPIPDLRLATADDLEYVLRVNSQMAFEEGRINPLHRDPSGFRQRTARRIEQGRVWIWVRDEKPIFKVDVVGETPDAMYLEGVHVHPEERRKGYGKRCLSQLSSILLSRTQTVCLTLNQRMADTAAFYAKAGFEFHSEYETIYLKLTLSQGS